MARSNNQKAKILYLQQMLLETGENHTMSMQMILKTLLENGIPAERKSIYDDLEVLRSFGMDIRYRRERPAGYYLAGKIVEEPEKVPDTEIPQAEMPEAEVADKKVPEAEVSDTEKKMRLLCSSASMADVKAYFGDKAEYKEKENGDFVAVAALSEEREFYGWLTAMGRKVHLQKPKKAAKNYRDYLKAIAREYKM